MMPATDMPLPMGGGSQRNAVPYYDLPAMQVTNHAVIPMPIRVSALRALGAYLNVFAIESFMDELALASGQDPVSFRLRHVSDPRARAVIEAVVRLLPGAMGNGASPVNESFGASGLLEEPQFTRPADFRGWQVPDVLRGGDHARIERWRLAQALHRTLRQRPDLIENRGGLSETDRRLLEEFPPVPYP